MQTAHSMKEYHKDLQEALDDSFLRKTLDKFAVDYKANREKIFQGHDIRAMIKEVADAKDIALSDMPKLIKMFTDAAEKKGVKVHFAKTPADANAIICKIAKDGNVKNIIKAKSMTAEETLLNHDLEHEGYSVVETDLGEWIIQNRHEGPSHMVMPAIHLSRYQVADLFSEITGEKQDSDVQKLVKVSRAELRSKFAEADMGITGANFLIAGTGSWGICTNEGNGRLTGTLPRIQVAIAGIDKLVPSIKDALKVIRVLARNGTAQAITSYVSWFTGVNLQDIDGGKKKEVHVVLLDNGRTALEKDEKCREVLRCVRCGACANVCPVYRLVGGHKMGHIYIGAIGLIFTYFYHGRDKAKYLMQNCVNCGACKDVCAAGIDLPGIITELRARINEEEGSTIESTLLAKVMPNRKLFHSLLKFAKFSQAPITGGTPYMRHLPDLLLRGQGFRTLPALAKKSFREMWASIKPTNQGKIRVGLFAGCAQDFIYPEQLKAAMDLFVAKECSVDFPEAQNCCGLPLQMYGERKAAQGVALQNVNAFGTGNFDYIVTLCASCASCIKHSYVELLKGHHDEALVQQFCDRIVDYSAFVKNTLGVTAEEFTNAGETVTHHAPCHQCRGLGVTEEPHDLIEMAGKYVEAKEYDSCCGFGGSYSIKFPEISSQILERKLNNFKETNAQVIVTDCPGCVLQLRGGAKANNISIKVEHMSEFMLRNLKK